MLPLQAHAPLDVLQVVPLCLFALFPDEVRQHGVCENTCPLGAVKVRCGCYAAVEAERCVGCGKCAKLCPVGCIEVKVRADA